MATLGDVIRAKVERVEVFGIFLRCGEIEVLVLIPQLSWIPAVSDCREFAVNGDEYDVRLISYDRENERYMGSIKMVRPEANPWSDLSLFAVGTEYVGVVRHAIHDGTHAICGYILGIRPGVMGYLAKSAATQSLSVGQSLRVVITGIDAEKESLTFELPQP